MTTMAPARLEHLLRVQQAHRYRVLQVNDCHISDQPPRMRTDTYLDDVLAKLSAVMEIASYNEVDAVVFTGDIFHRKTASHTTHRTVERVRAILNGPEVPVYIVPGNHDERVGGGLTGQPLMNVLGDNVSLLIGISPADPYIAGVAWDNRMEGPDGADFIRREVDECDGAPLIFMHAPLTPHPFPFGPEARGWIEIDALDSMLPDTTLVVAHGHMHGGHGVFARNGLPYGSWSRWYSNPGALARATIGADDIDREPRVALITYDPDERLAAVEYLPVPHRPAAEVFRLEQRAAEVERSEGISALAGALAGASTHAVTADVLSEHIRALPPPEGVDELAWLAAQQVAIEAIENADAGRHQ